MSALDIFVILLLGGGAMIGFVRGFVHEVLSLFAWVVAIAMLKLFHTPAVGGARPTSSGREPGAAVVAFALLFMPSFMLVKLLARSIGGKTRRSMLGPVDRVLGGGFGMLKGLIGATLFFLLANLATDMIYGPRGRPAGVDDQFAHLSACSTPAAAAVVDWVETRAARAREPRRDPAARHDGAREAGVRARRPKRITMYVCGPTVYGRAHIGNARPAVVFDTLARLIRHEYGPDSLVYARNVTDVDDKIIAAAEAEGVEPSVITERYERIYLEDMGALGVPPPTIAPHATARNSGR